MIEIEGFAKGQTVELMNDDGDLVEFVVLRVEGDRLTARLKASMDAARAEANAEPESEAVPEDETEPSTFDGDPA